MARPSARGPACACRGDAKRPGAVWRCNSLPWGAPSSPWYQRLLKVLEGFSAPISKGGSSAVGPIGAGAQVAGGDLSAPSPPGLGCFPGLRVSCIAGPPGRRCGCASLAPLSGSHCSPHRMRGDQPPGLQSAGGGAAVLAHSASRPRNNREALRPNPTQSGEWASPSPCHEADQAAPLNLPRMPASGVPPCCAVHLGEQMQSLTLSR